MLIQPLSMPVTPLALGLWRYEKFTAIASCKKDTPAALVVAPRTPIAEPTAAQNVVRGDRGICNDLVGKEARDESAPVVKRAGAAAEAPVARYASVDPHTGRVWGVPSAFGKGQCLNCPGRAAPPSTLCVACQLSRAQTVHDPMPKGQFQSLRSAFGALLEDVPDGPGKEKSIVAQRLDQLYTKLKAGRIEPEIQAQLAEIVNALAANDRVAANRKLQVISAQHWEQQKDWLIGVRRLLAAR